MIRLAGTQETYSARGKKSLYTIPTVRTTPHNHGPRRRANCLACSHAPACRSSSDSAIPTLLGRPTPAGTISMSEHGGRHSHRLGLKVDRAGSCGSATWWSPLQILVFPPRLLPLKTDPARDALSKWCWPNSAAAHFCAMARAETHARLARQARHADGKSLASNSSQQLIRRAQGRQSSCG